MKVVFQLMAILILMSACSEPSFEGSKQGQKGPSVIQMGDLEKNIRVRVDPLEEPGKYIVTFTWPTIAGGKFVRIGQGKIYSEAMSTQTFFTHKVEDGSQLTYVFQVLNDAKVMESSFSKVVSIPKDFFGKRELEVNASGLAVYNRMFLDKDNELVVGEKNVTFSINELHSKDGTISNFPQSSEVVNGGNQYDSIENTAQIGRSGLAGSNLVIRINKLMGTLHVNMRGQRGGPGIPTPQKSGNGKRGKDGEAICTGVSVASQVVTREPIDKCIEFRCTNGIGEMGDIGWNGSQGLNGGDSGDLILSVKEVVKPENQEIDPDPNINKYVIVTQSPGLGGIGGVGGVGQLGGFPGLCKGMNCNQCPDLPLGPQGPQGKRGLDGPEGDKGKVCIYLGSENYNACE